MKKYIKAIYSDFELWYARFDNELGYYVSDGLIKNLKDYEINIVEKDEDNSVLYDTKEVKEISKEKYIDYIKKDIFISIDNDIRILNNKINKLKEFKNSIGHKW